MNTNEVMKFYKLITSKSSGIVKPISFTVPRKVRFHRSVFYILEVLVPYFTSIINFIMNKPVFKVQILIPKNRQLLLLGQFKGENKSDCKSIIG